MKDCEQCGRKMGIHRLGDETVFEANCREHGVPAFDHRGVAGKIYQDGDTIFLRKVWTLFLEERAPPLPEGDLRRLKSILQHN